MKINKIVCPKCSASMTSKAGIEEGTSINCPKCKHPFKVKPAEEDEVVEDFDVVDDEEETPKKPAAKPTLTPLSKKQPVVVDEDDEDEEVEDEAPKKAASKPSLKPLSKKQPVEVEDDEDDEEGETPRKSAAKSGLKPLSKRNRNDDDDDDEEESPRSKRKGRDDDDDDDDEPRSRRKGRDDDDDDDDSGDDDEPTSAYGKLKKNIYVRGAVLGVLLVIMGVLGYLLYDKYKKKGDDDSAKKDDDDPSKPLIKDDRQPTGKKPDIPIPGKKNDAAEQAKFQGRWRLARMTAGGQELPAEFLAQVSFRIQGDQIVVSAGKKDETERMILDPTQNPAHIDTIGASNKIDRGIYRFIDNDNVEICTSESGRPTAFESPPGSKVGLFVLTRSKQ